MMTRQHYEEIAYILAVADDMSDVIRRMSDYLAHDNPRFDRARFSVRIEQIASEKAESQ